MCAMGSRLPRSDNFHSAPISRAEVCLQLGETHASLMNNDNLAVDNDLPFDIAGASYP
jgi:hypothetical protein